jgi:fluoride exporter
MRYIGAKMPRSCPKIVFFLKKMKELLLVFVGGGLGSVGRYGLSVLLRPYALRFPWATLVANVLACWVLGMVLAQVSAGRWSEAQRLLLATGFCGGLSTFSTFAAESTQASPALLLANVLLHLVLCFGAMWLGGKCVFG